MEQEHPLMFWTALGTFSDVDSFEASEKVFSFITISVSEISKIQEPVTFLSAR